MRFIKEWEDREWKACRTISNYYIVDDGWNLPEEIIEIINFRIQMAYTDAYRRVCNENNRHRGKWIDYDVVHEYIAKSWIYRVFYGGQYIGEVRKMGEELQREYGVTELEAINIMNGRNIQDYLMKYHRIKNRIAMSVDEQGICNSTINEYCYEKSAM